MQADDAAQPAIREELRSVFGLHEREHWISTLGPADTCVAPVASIPEVVADPHLQARHVFVEATRAEAAPFRQVGWVLGARDTGGSRGVYVEQVTPAREALGIIHLDHDACCR